MTLEIPVGENNLFQLKSISCGPTFTYSVVVLYYLSQRKWVDVLSVGMWMMSHPSSKKVQVTLVPLPLWLLSNLTIDIGISYLWQIFPNPSRGCSVPPDEAPQVAKITFAWCFTMASSSSSNEYTLPCGLDRWITFRPVTKFAIKNKYKLDMRQKIATTTNI